MEVPEILEEMEKRARRDEPLRRRLLATRTAEVPAEAFCRICGEEGLPLYVMDLIEYGETCYAATRRSTNGGGENSPALAYQDDYYEMFMTALEDAGGAG